ncbi:MAG: hypothetical protein KIT20_12510 [Alphaproteobacteria bacterium]|nr:hypothetical protein [Alphaproteobacteria bacterium]
MPLHVLCLLVLAIAALVALGLLRHGELPAALFWALGLGLIAAMASVGAAAFAGLEAARGPHLFLTGLAANVGSFGLLLAGLFSFFLRLPGTLGLLVAALAVALLIAVGIGVVPTFGLGMPAIAAIGLGLTGLVGLRIRPRAATWLLAGVAAAVLAEAGRNGLMAGLPIHPLDLYHLLLALAVLGFGLTARHA